MKPDPLASILAGAVVDKQVYALRPDYRALLIAVDGLEPATDGSAADVIVGRAEESAREALADRPVEEVPHVAAWRDAYRAFGAKPQRTRHSLEALMRRAPDGLPRVNLLTDIYNAISVIHQVPVGGEDLNRYAGPPRLVRATGQEPFDTVASGDPVVEHPAPGEVVWCDDVGVTCRRWNWRQARRTALREDTTSALFILDALDPISDGALRACADHVVCEVQRLGPEVRVAQRVLRAGV